MRRKLVLSGAVLMMVLTFTACSNGSDNFNSGSGVSTVVVKAASSTDSVISGKIEAVNAANVVSKMTGKVAQVNVDIGSEVGRGQVVVSLESADFEAGVEAAQAALDTAQINLDLAAQNLERARVLMESGAMSQADFHNNYQGPYLKAEAAVKSCEAALKKAEIAYDDCFIRAPFDGVVSARNANPGEMASVQAVLVSLVNLDQVVIKGTVNERQINHLELGQEVEVNVSAAGAKAMIGRICNISPAAESSTKAYPIKIKVENPEHLLKPGMFAEVRLPQNGAVSLAVPREALQKEGEIDFVYVVEEGIVKKRCVTTGQEANGQIQISSGLSEGEIVVVAGATLLQPGQKI